MAVFSTTRTRWTPVASSRLLVRAGNPTDNLEIASQETVAAASSKASTTLAPERPVAVAAVAVFGSGLALSAWLSVATTSGGPRIGALAGIGAFAIFYVAAQAAERLAELTSPLYLRGRYLDKKHAGHERDTKSAAASKAQGGQPVAAPVSQNNPPPPSPEQQAADAQATVDQVTTNRRIVFFAVTAFIGMMLCGYVHADFLGAVGVATPDGSTPTQLAIVISLGVTGLIVGGGSDGLHGLITNLSKSSDQKNTPPATGGTA